MNPIHTHYDNLKVTRNAPTEVIRAAYKTLSQKYHPDKHLGKVDAARVMALINVSYQILADPVQRAEHDRWIEHQERLTTPTPSSTWPRQESPHQSHTAPQPAPQQTQAAVGAMSGLVSHVLRHWLRYALAGGVIWSVVNSKPSTPPVRPMPYQDRPAPAIPAKINPTYVKPTAAPNSEPWPSSAGYVKGYEQLHTNGLSTVTVDNSRNDSEVFAKLVSLDGDQAYPVRQFYIPAFGSFTLKNASAGSYDIRYRDLTAGGLSRSEAFILSEIHTNEGTQFSNITMTLYKVRNGNMKTYGLVETEF